MRSELNECALGADLRGIRSAFYFYESEARNVNSASSGLNLAAAWPAAIAMEHCSDLKQIGAYRATLDSRSRFDLSKECIKHSPSLPAVAR